VDALDRVATRLGVTPSGEVRETLSRGGETAGWEAFTAVVAGLREGRLADGIAVMTFEMDPPEGFGARIVAALHDAGVP
jgi:hypothetical protein